jgi:hypothetical protein
MNKIILINCYLGKLPWYFEYFLKSCETNPTIDFILFLDDNVTGTIPENVQIINYNLEKFNTLASNKLNLDIDIKSGYKLCDFKPAYGIIFEEYINNYNFWGVCDIDLVFGRIREFMTDDLLNQYDVISVKDSFPSGYFLLFKNKNKINNLFKKSKDYKKIFQTSKNYCFDECGGTYDEVIRGINILDTDTETESIHHILIKEKDNINVHFDLLIIEGTPGNLKWNKGILSYKDEFEILLYHFSNYKNNNFSAIKKWGRIPNIFYIDKYNIRKKSYLGILPKWTDKLKPTIKNSMYKIDMFISFYFKSSAFQNLSVGKYSYMSRTLYIEKKENGQNCMQFENHPVKFDLIKMYFHSNFFFNAETKIYYKKENKKFSEILNDGNLITYSKS